MNLFRKKGWLLLSATAVFLTWKIQTVDSSQVTGLATSTTADYNNNYLISYSDNKGQLKFAKSTSAISPGKSWSLKTIPTDNAIDPFTFITTDQNNNYLILYFDSQNYFLKLAKSTNAGENWQSFNIDQAGAGGVASLTTDSDGTYLVAYTDNIRLKLHFARSTDGGISWTKQTIDAAALIGTNSASITTDGGSYLIAYQEIFNNSLKFASSRDKGVSWTTTTIDDNDGSVGDFACLAVDNEGTYLISYRDTSFGGNLKFAISRDKGVSWQKSTIVDNGSVAGYSCSLAVNKTNSYWISYYDNQSNNLRLARSQDKGASWIIETVDNNSFTGRHNSLAIDRLNQPIIAYSQFFYPATRGFDSDLLFALSLQY